MNSTDLPQISNKFAGIGYWVQTGKGSKIFVRSNYCWIWSYLTETGSCSLHLDGEKTLLLKRKSKSWLQNLEKIQKTKENNACLWRGYQSSYRKLEESESLCLLETVEISKISKSKKETYSGLYFYLFRYWTCKSG